MVRSGGPYFHLVLTANLPGHGTRDSGIVEEGKLPTYLVAAQYRVLVITGCMTSCELPRANSRPQVLTRRELYATAHICGCL